MIGRQQGRDNRERGTHHTGIFDVRAQVEKELKNEIKALGEQLQELRTLGAVVEEQADEHGDFIFRTATYMVDALKDWYEHKLMNRKNKRR